MQIALIVKPSFAQHMQKLVLRTFIQRLSNQLPIPIKDKALRNPFNMELLVNLAARIKEELRQAATRKTTIAE